MIENKYKAWLKDEKKMIYDKYGICSFFGDQSPVSDFGKDTIGDGVELFKYTGLKDIKGKEMYYDSEIFKFEYMDIDQKIKLIGSFHFNDTDLNTEIEVYGHSLITCLTYNGYGMFKNFKVIGTKQENPELLTKPPQK